MFRQSVGQLGRASLGGKRATLDLSFVSGAALDSRLTFTRASVGPYFDSTGTMQSAAINAARIDYGPNSVWTNWIRNSTMVGAVPGTPGTLPTNWSQGQNTGIIPAVVGTGTENGISYVDLRFVGTTSGSNNNNVFPESGVVSAGPNQTWTLSSYLRLVGGSFTNVSSIQLLGGDNVVHQQVPGTLPTSAALSTQRQSYTWTTNAGAVTTVVSGIQFVPVVGVAIDFTIRIGAPQLEQSSSANTFVPTSGVTASNSVTNWIANSTMVGAVAGVQGSGGSLPTGWNINASGGLTTTIVGTGTSGGLTYIDINYSGTTVGTFHVFAFNNALISVPNLTPCTQSVYCALVAGSLSGVTVSIDSRYSSGLIDSTILPTATLTRFSDSTTTVATAVNMQPCMVFAFSNGATLNFTLRYAAPQFEVGPSFANTFVPTSGTVANAGATPLGLLIEEARTNSIRNNTMVGAVAGTPGTLPTNWTSAVGSSLTQAVVGTGTEYGIPYIDVRLFGTASANGISYWTIDIPAALPAQVWTASAYFRLVGGSFANLTAMNIQNEDHDSGGGILGGTSISLLGVTSSSLASQRVSATQTAVASTAFKYLVVLAAFNNGAVIDFTLRIGLPQLELGSFVTSAVQTSTVALTRSADVATIPVGSWFSATAGSWALEWSQSVRLASGRLIGRSDNRGGTLLQGDAAGGTVSEYDGQQVTTANGITAGVTAKAASSWIMGAAQVCLNGGTVATSASLITGFGAATAFVLFGDSNPTDVVTGYIHRVRYWKYARSAVEMVSDTT